MQVFSCVHFHLRKSLIGLDHRSNLPRSKPKSDCVAPRSSSTPIVTSEEVDDEYIELFLYNNGLVSWAQGDRRESIYDYALFGSPIDTKALPYPGTWHIDRGNLGEHRKLIEALTQVDRPDVDWRDSDQIIEHVVEDLQPRVTATPQETQLQYEVGEEEEGTRTSTPRPSRQSKSCGVLLYSSK